MRGKLEPPPVEANYRISWMIGQEYWRTVAKARQRAYEISREVAGKVVLSVKDERGVGWGWRAIMTFEGGEPWAHEL